MNTDAQPNEPNEISLPREVDETNLGIWLNAHLSQPAPAAQGPLPSPLGRGAADRPSRQVQIRRGRPRPRMRPPDSVHFGPRRRPLHAVRRKVRHFLRYRLSPGDLARIIATVPLLAGGAGLIAATAMRYVTHVTPTGAARPAWQIPLMLASYALMWIVGLTVPSLVIIKFIADLPWFRVIYYFSIIWFLAGLALFA